MLAFFIDQHFLLDKRGLEALLSASAFHNLWHYFVFVDVLMKIQFNTQFVRKRKPFN